MLQGNKNTQCSSSVWCIFRRERHGTSWLSRFNPTWDVSGWGSSSHCANPRHSLTFQRNIKKCASYHCRLNHVCSLCKPQQKHMMSLKKRMGLSYAHSEPCTVAGACPVKWVQERPHIKTEPFLFGCQLRLYNTAFKHVCGEVFAALTFIGITTGAQHLQRMASASSQVSDL